MIGVNAATEGEKMALVSPGDVMRPTEEERRGRKFASKEISFGIFFSRGQKQFLRFLPRGWAESEAQKERYQQLLARMHAFEGELTPEDPFKLMWEKQVSGELVISTPTSRAWDEEKERLELIGAREGLGPWEDGRFGGL